MKASGFSSYLGMGMLAIGATFLQASMVNAAHAADSPPRQTIRVSDLDLSKSEDVAKLYHRIQDAAEATCGSASVTGSILTKNVHLQCVAETVERTVSKFNNATLSAYHKQETGQSHKKIASAA